MVKQYKNSENSSLNDFLPIGAVFGRTSSAIKRKRYFQNRNLPPSGLQKSYDSGGIRTHATEVTGA